MRRYIVTLLLLCCAVLPLWAQTSITGLTAKLAERFDVSWTLTVNTALTTPLQFAITQANGDGILRIVGNQLSWQPAGAAAPTMTAPLNLVAGSSYSLGIKRRPDTMAVLFEHRLLFAVPISSFAAEKVAFTQVPDSITIADTRYQRISAPKLGDDFMRKDAVSGVKAGSTAWVEDPSWLVQYYQVDDPGANPPKDARGIPAMNPWRLSLFPMVESSANGFWFLYTGVGPSWAVGNSTMSFPFWDKYYVSAAVKPDFDSTVGMIAAYQDNKNYLLFRWQQREYDTNLGHRAQLVAIIDGKETIIGEADRGFDPGQWFNIRINLGWQQAQVMIDGKLLIQGVNPGNIEGRAGMYADGVAKPRRINPDEATVKMYQTVDTKNPTKVLNDSTLSQDEGTLVYFDDVKVGDWTAQENTSSTGGYAFEKTGIWDTRNNAFTAISPGRYLTGSFATSSYQASTKLTAGNAGAGIYFHLDPAGNGYLWEIAGGIHKLQQVTNYTVTATLGTAPQAIDEDSTNLRIKADGPYVALYCNDKLILDYYDANRTQGRIGLLAAAKGVVFSDFTITALESSLNKVKVHNRFAVDRYMAAWATEDGEWYPVVLPAAAVTPAGFAFAMSGAASPYPTNIAGLYWHKAGHYGDFRITLDYALGALAKQKIHLSTKYDPASGYIVELDTVDNKGVARLYRQDKLVGEYTFDMSAKTQLVLERKGGYYLLHALDLDPDITDIAYAIKDDIVFAYHDAMPLPANMIGFTVTGPKIKASDAHIETEGVIDAFEVSPTNWISGSGIWAVMQKFSCQPQWNWFGGFGGGNPTVWNKYKLEGDQVIEVFEGVKMAVDAEVSAEQYALRYRDMNMSFCADGKHINSGYSVIRGGRLAGVPTTMLLREGKVVMTSVKAEDLLPAQSSGHRVWFATRVEKRSIDGGKAEIRVYIDNHLSMTYIDDKPLTGGYVAFWTHNNGMMIARANIFAEKMTVGEPRAAAPLTMKDEDTTVLPTATVTMNDVPLVIANFENDKDNFVERPGLTGRLVRDSVTDGRGVTNHFLRVINSYPSGDFSVSGMLKNIDLLKTPNLHFDYNLDMGVKLNMYLRLSDKWYEVVLTGKLAQSKVYTIGKVTTVADGGWHHFEANVGKMLVDAITTQTGAAPTSLVLQEIDFADWSASSDMREYGFNSNNGGLSYCLDNLTALPAVTDKVTLTWTNDKLKTWRTGVDNLPVNAPAIDATTQQAVIDPKQTLQFFHLRGTDADGKVGGIVNVPIPALVK